MGSMLHAASQPDAKGAASRRAHKQGRWLQLDLNMYDNIMLPINLPQHWLLAWIDAKSRRLHLLDCSKEYGKGWRGTIHGLLWIWLVASVRRRNAATGAAATEPIWSIDLRTVDVHDLSLLPGFTREARDRILRCRRDTTETLSTVKSVLGASNIIKLTNLNIELRWGGPGDPWHWQWSSKPLAVPQQTRKCDCAIFTFLYSAFVTRGWDLSQLRAFDPQAARAWIQQVLLREGKWARQWTCCAWRRDPTRRTGGWRCTPDTCAGVFRPGKERMSHASSQTDTSARRSITSAGGRYGGLAIRHLRPKGESTSGVHSDAEAGVSIHGTVQHPPGCGEREREWWQASDSGGLQSERNPTRTKWPNGGGCELEPPRSAAKAGRECLGPRHWMQGIDGVAGKRRHQIKLQTPHCEAPGEKREET